MKVRKLQGEFSVSERRACVVLDQPRSTQRDEFLNQEEFESLRAARQQTQAWREDYNHYRPHSSLGYVTAAEFAARCGTASVLPAASLQQPHSRD